MRIAKREYQKFLVQIKSRIQTAQTKAVLSVNAELIYLFAKNDNSGKVPQPVTQLEGSNIRRKTRMANSNETQSCVSERV